MSEDKRFVDSFPELAQEIEGLLVEEGEPDLAAQVRDLKIVNRCRCGDDFCATIYTMIRPKRGYDFTHRNVPLPSDKGMICLDIVDEKIAGLEILFRDEIREKLLQILP